MPLSGAEQKAVARALRDIYTKKLIVSRQPIFTNLKSNTMKTLQKYDFIFNGQIFIEKNVLSRCFFVNISDFQS